jgi:subtilisin family serine protease
MNTRLAVSTLGLALLLAACGQQMPTSGSSTGDTQASTPERVARTTAPLLGTDNAGAIPGQYIVVFSDGAASANLGAQDAGGLIRSLGLDPQGITVQYLYAQALNGFAAKLSAQNLATLRSDPRVKYIEQDSVMRATATQTGATWGLDRIDQSNLPLDGNYVYNATASNVTAYIIDTGINTAHTAFGGRAVWGTNTTGDGNNSDCQGHGTHVAGTVGSSTWGVAKGVKLVAVKVLGCDGSGTNSGVIAGVNWAVGNKTGPAVANMSLGGGASQALDDAVNNAAAKNLVMAVAAGNENQNACNVSPARAVSAITVGATTKTDSRDTSYSNYGNCVDLFAPGTGITSTWVGSTTATNTISGTSMASPHVAGAAALILASNPGYTTAQVTSALKSSATANKVTSAGTGSPNLLLFTGTGGTVTPPPASGTTYTGTVSSRTSSYQPGTTGFSYAGGTLKGTLSGPSGTDFDLFLQKRGSNGIWSDVAASESGTSNESVTYAAGSGTYRWDVYAYSGSGSYSLTETK